eukprot:2985872-Rhodomonas_salina.5
MAWAAGVPDGNARVRVDARAAAAAPRGGPAVPARAAPEKHPGAPQVPGPLHLPASRPPLRPPRPQLGPAAPSASLARAVLRLALME